MIDDLKFPASDLQDRVQSILQVVAQRRMVGEDLSDDEVLAEYPQLADALVSGLAKLQIIERAGRKAKVLRGKDTDTALHYETPKRSSRLRVRCPHCRDPYEMASDAPLEQIICSNCGGSFRLVGTGQETQAADVLQTIAHFDLIECLGMGSFGTVWKGYDRELDRTVAVKIPRHNSLDGQNTEKFLREARAAAQLQHPHIVSVHEVGREGDTVFIVSDYIRGISLNDWLSDQQPAARQAAELSATIAEALHHAHERGVIHRDLKPSNIMIDGDGQPHLMDFGLARRDGVELTITLDGQILGTPAYMSPEQALGEAHIANRTTDIYSLGVILYQLLTGEIPFRGNAHSLMQHVVHVEPPNPRTLNSGIPQDLVTITLKCLEKDPKRRYPTAENLKLDLQRWMRGEPIHARPIGRGERAWRWCRRNSALAVAIGATLILSIAIAVGSPILAFRIANARLEADASRQKEIALHNRLLLSQEFDKAQMRIADGDFAAAEEVVSHLDDWQSRIHSRNTVEVLQQLANWHGSHKRWKNAADYYQTLSGLNLSELNFDWNSVALTHVQYAPLLVTLEDVEAYEEMRESAIARFRTHTNSSTCERLLNSCVILPWSPRHQSVLKKWAEGASRFGENLGRHAGWNCLAIALYEYRLGNNTEAIAWGQRAIDFKLSPNCTARAQVVMAMALSRLGRSVDSQATLSQCRKVIEARLQGTFANATYETGYWYDWLAAGILLREALEQIPEGR